MSDNKIKIDMAKVISQEELATNIFSMGLETTAANDAKAGQFVSVYTNDASALLPRPISICEINEEKTALRLVYRVVGKGTSQFSKMTAGDTVKVIGSLGNGYTLENKTAILAAGGIGIPPIVELAKQLKICNNTHIRKGAIINGTIFHGRNQSSRQSHRNHPRPKYFKCNCRA